MSSSCAIDITDRSTVAFLIAAVAHQGLVELDRVEGEAGEIGERDMTPTLAPLLR
nr:hypothetical protein [Rhizobium laguerreae]